MYGRVTLLFFVFVLSSCASTPKEPNKFGHYHEYPYKAPDYVIESDDDECSRMANSKAFASIQDTSDAPAKLFGAIGAMFTLGTATMKLNAVYEKTMKSCLRERGYNIPD